MKQHKNGMVKIILFTAFASCAAQLLAGAAVRPYDIEVWELEPVSNSAVTTVLDYAPSDPVAMGGARRGFCHGMKMPERVPVEEGTEYMLSFEGRVADSEGSFILYAKAFDEKGRDVTTLTNPPGVKSVRFEVSCWRGNDGCIMEIETVKHQ